jgi:hypothetical protein
MVNSIDTNLSAGIYARGFEMELVGVEWLDLLLAILNIFVSYITCAIKYQQNILLKHIY